MFQTSIPFSSSRRHIISFSGAQFGDHVSGGCFGVFHLQRASPGQQHHGGCGWTFFCRHPRRASGCRKPLRHYQLIHQLPHLLLVWKQVQNHIHAGTTFTRLATNNNPLSIHSQQLLKSGSSFGHFAEKLIPTFWQINYPWFKTLVSLLLVAKKNSKQRACPKVI